MKKKLAALVLTFCMALLPMTFAMAATPEDATVYIDSNADLVRAIQTQQDGQTWVFTNAGEFDAKNTEDSEGRYKVEGVDQGEEFGFPFPIHVDNLTITKAEDVEGDVTITSSYEATSGNWYEQNFLTVFGDGLTIDGVNLKANKNNYSGNFLCNKAIEFVDGASNFTLKNMKLEALEGSAGKGSGSIYISSSDVGTSSIENVEIASYISAGGDGYKGTLKVTNLTQDFTDSVYTEGGYSYGVEGPGEDGTLKTENVTIIIDNADDLSKSVFTERLPDGAVIQLADGEYDDLNLPLTSGTCAGKSFTIRGGEDVTVESITAIGTGEESVAFEDINFTGASTEYSKDTTPSALYLQKLTSAAVENCTFSYEGKEEVATGVTTVSVGKTVISDSTIVGYTIPGYHNPSDSAQTVTYEGNTIQNAESGIGFIGIDEVIVTGNTFENANGVRLYPDWSAEANPCGEATIKGNKFLSLPEDPTYGQYAVKTTDGKNSGFTGELKLDLNYWGTTDKDEILSMIDTGSEDKTGIILDEWYLAEDPDKGTNLKPSKPSRPGNSGNSGGSSGRPLPSGGSGTETGPAFESDTTYDLTVNDVYQFRITSLDGHTPAMTLGNGNFRVELASRSGNDYFFKVYVQGNAGSTCGVFVDGQYLLTLTVGGSAVVSDTTAPFTVAQGGTYQFKLTAAQRPAFVAGSPCFTVEYAGNSGNDWFYKVHAVGEAGESSGFYINGSASPVAVASIG